MEGDWFKNMKGLTWIKKIAILGLIIITLWGTGCKNDVSEEGYIYRNNIELSDLAFLFDRIEYIPGETTINNVYKAFKYDTKPEDVFDALGLPVSTTDRYGVKEYRYLIGDQYDSVAISFDLRDDTIIDFDPIIHTEYSEDSVVEAWTTGCEKVDVQKYKMKKRFDISEDELGLITENIDSNELQRIFGAPHYYIETYDVNIEGIYSNVFVFKLENTDVLKVVFSRKGHILHAWVEDADGNQIDTLINSETSNFYDSIKK